MELLVYSLEVHRLLLKRPALIQLWQSAAHFLTIPLPLLPAFSLRYIAARVLVAEVELVP